MSTRVIVLLATIPSRRQSCERLLGELARQTRRPDAVLLVMDGFDDAAPSPKCSLPVFGEFRSPTLQGPGHRWSVAESLLPQELGGVAVAETRLDPDDILVCVDDDAMLFHAPKFVEGLVAAVESGGGAAAGVGRQPGGKPAPPGAYSFGDLIYGAGSGLTVRARHLQGLQDFAAEVRFAGGPQDALGRLGDDDALVSAYLWRCHVRLCHAVTGNFYAAPNTQSVSQGAARHKAGETFDSQKRALRKAIGWPWPDVR